MANVNIQLSNTAAQIDQTVSETYNRLTGNYVGPVIANSNAASGFMIQNANKQNGLFVGNSNTQFYNNCLNFNISNSDTYLCLYSNRSLYFAGNNSCIFQFNHEGSASFGSTINSSYKGVQIYSTGASLILKDTDSTQNNAIRFFNNLDVQTFYICKNGSSSLDVCSVDSLNFYSKANSNPSLLLSGANASINSFPESNYALKVSGKSYFTNCSDFSGCLNINNFVNITNPLSTASGITFNTIPIFNRIAIFCNDIIISGSGNLIIQSGSVRCLIATENNGTVLKYNSGIFDVLCLTGGVNNFSSFDSQTIFKKQICSQSGILFNNSYVSGSGCSYIYASEVFGTGKISTIGLFSVNSPGFNHEIRGTCLTIATTGIGNNLIFNSTPTFNSNLNVTGFGCFSSICSTGAAATNNFAGNLNVTKDINAANLIISNYLTGFNICYTNCMYGKGACLETICVFGSNSINSICGNSKFLGVACFCETVCLTDKASLIVNTTGNHIISGCCISLTYDTGIFSGYSCFTNLIPVSINQTGFFTRNTIGHTSLNVNVSGRNQLINGCNFIGGQLCNHIYSNNCNIFIANGAAAANKICAAYNCTCSTLLNLIQSRTCNIIQSPETLISGDKLCLCNPTLSMANPQDHNQTAIYWGTIYINNTGFKFPLYLI
jgi:hypothetical protein